jgi:hypothetical protein
VRHDPCTRGYSTVHTEGIPKLQYMYHQSLGSGSGSRRARDVTQNCSPRAPQGPDLNCVLYCVERTLWIHGLSHTSAFTVCIPSCIFIHSFVAGRLVFASSALSVTTGHLLARWYIGTFEPCKHRCTSGVSPRIVPYVRGVSTVSSTFSRRPAYTILVQGLLLVHGAQRLDRTRLCR